MIYFVELESRVRISYRIECGSFYKYWWFFGEKVLKVSGFEIVFFFVFDVIGGFIRSREEYNFAFVVSFL